MRQDLREAIAGIRPRIQDFAKVENARVKVIHGDGPEPSIGPTKDGLGQDFHELVELQKITNPSIPMINGRVWAKRLYDNLCRVCQIEVDQVARGTGFLVGPNAVLTNWHVVENAAPQSIRCRFDYAIDMAGAARDGTVVELSDPGIVLSSPYWANEKKGLRTPGGAPPDCLDFALLHINRDQLRRPEPRPALDELPTPEERGFVQIPANPIMPNAGHPLIILQHPQGLPVQAALDTSGAIGWELSDQNGNLYWTGPENTRFRYRTNTMGGSSGSPCFSMDWKLVALHHMGHTGSALAPVANQGVPVGLIRKKIVEAGFESYLS
ncbi:trypsin-like peptidase [Phreatobacter oligotrophus]|uniref:Trypsin-like peptidase n=1 Tax=Phreatobacter oligotrophus TaxID=1122261 RepID=A0A2T4YYC3_9HYPH|nr:trypsin-like peptidase [Phreatobacter oligotrophus]